MAKKKKRNMFCYTVKVYEITGSGIRLDHGKTIISALNKKQALECACSHASTLFIRYCGFVPKESGVHGIHTYEVEVIGSKGEIYTSFRIVTDQQEFSNRGGGGGKRGITEGESAAEMQAIRESYWDMQIKIAAVKKKAGITT